MKYSYALIGGTQGHIEQYVDGSVVNTDEYTEWKDFWGQTCRCGKGDFITGSLDELQEILNSERKRISERTREALNKLPNATDTEKKLIRCLVEDGCSTDEITDDFIKSVLEGMKPYFEWNSTFEGAYMDYMH